MPINEFRNRIAVNKYIFSQNDMGGNIKALVDSYNVWAKMESINGSRLLENLQINYTKAYKITTRYEDSRKLNNSDEIAYNGYVYVLQGVTQIEEGRRNFNVMIAYSSGDNSNAGDILYRVEKIIHFTASGGEYTLTDTRLINAEIAIVFRDGIEYRVVSGTPGHKEVKLDATAGSITFSTDDPALSPNENADVYLIAQGTWPSAGLSDYYTKEEVNALLGTSESGGISTITVIAGQDLSSWRVVYIDNGTAYYYDPSNISMTNYAIGITKAAALEGNQIIIQTEGVFESTGLGLTPDKKYFAGVNGIMTINISGLTVIQPIGNSITSDKLDINFNSPIITT